MIRARARGFTLIEVMVALAIVAVALSAGMRALAQSADGATSLKARTLASWVAENRLARTQLADPLPGIGTTDGSDVQAGVPFAWRQSVSATPNPAFRRVEIIVHDAGQPNYVLARLVGYVGARR
jgi:general secretion pathway protein I